MNSGSIMLFADSSEVSTFNNGKIDEMIGKALISANMNGEIGYQDKQTIILYSPRESAKRMSEYLQVKKESEEELKEEVQSEEVVAENTIEEINEQNEVTSEEQVIEENISSKKSRKKKSTEQQLKIDLDSKED